MLPRGFSNRDDLSKRVQWNQSANGYRLPTEAEWEYCARAGEEFLYAGSDEASEVAWYNIHALSETPIVGAKSQCGDFMT